MWVNIRTGPDMDARGPTDAGVGSFHDAVTQNEEWIQIAEGQWLPKQFLAPSSAAERDLYAEPVDETAAIAAMSSSDGRRQAVGVRFFRLKSAVDRSADPDVDRFLDRIVEEFGVVPRCVEFLAVDENPELQFEALWLLTNILSADTNHTTHLVDSGVVPHLVRLLGSPHVEVCLQAMWAVGNLAGNNDNGVTVDLLLHSGVMAPMLSLMSNIDKGRVGSASRPLMLRTAAWVLSSLCRTQNSFGVRTPLPLHARLDAVTPALPTLAHLLISSKDEEVLTQGCWALHSLSSISSIGAQAVLDAGVGRRLVELTGHCSSDVQVPALSAVGNITFRGMKQRMQLLDTPYEHVHVRTRLTELQAAQRRLALASSLLSRGPEHSVMELMVVDLVPVVGTLVDGAMGLVERLLACLGSTHANIRANACYIISSIAVVQKAWWGPTLPNGARSFRQQWINAANGEPDNIDNSGDIIGIQQLIDGGIVPPLARLMMSPSICPAAAPYAMVNMTKGTLEQVRYLVEQGVIRSLCVSQWESHTLEGSDDEGVLGGLEKLLKCGEEERRRSLSDRNEYAVLIREALGRPDRLEAVASDQMESDQVRQRARNLRQTLDSEEGSWPGSLPDNGESPERVDRFRQIQLYDRRDWRHARIG
jgi:hypothetical protein